MGIRRSAVLLAWTLIAAGLYFLFGLMLVGLGARSLSSLVGLEPGSSALLRPLLGAGLGVMFLGLARLYRRGAGRENAGSVAAWLAGLALLLAGVARALAHYRPALVLPLLLLLLIGWLAHLALARAAARRRSR